MAINIGENQNEQVTYVNSPDINRVLFKNLKDGASKEDIVDAVNDWLDDHPEATTTVEDGSILPVKLDSTNDASDGYVLSYNATAGKFEWVDIQSDINELKADLTQAETELRYNGKEKANLLETGTFVNRKYVNENGQVISITGNGDGYYYHTIPVVEGTRYFFHIKNSRQYIACRVHGYDANNEWVKQLDVFFTPEGKSRDYYTGVVIPSGIKYISVGTGGVLYIEMSDEPYIKPVPNLTNESYQENGFSIGETGSRTTNAQGIIYSGIDVTPGKYNISVYSITTGTSNIRIHGYDENGEWISQLKLFAVSTYGVNNTTFTVPNGVSKISISASTRTIVVGLNKSPYTQIYGVPYIQNDINNVKTEYVNMGNPYIYLSDTIEDIILDDTDVDDVYAIYDALCASNPNYIKRMDDIGYDESGLPMRLYRVGWLKPFVAGSGNEAKWESNLNIYIPYYDYQKLFINAGTHGNEKSSVYGVALSIQEIVTSDDPWAEYIRGNFIIDVCPVANPWGYNNTSRNGYGDVNINRDFLTRSRSETQAIYNLVKNGNYYGYIDSHNSGGNANYFGITNTNPRLKTYVQMNMKLAGIVYDSWKALAQGETYATDPYIQCWVEEPLGMLQDMMNELDIPGYLIESVGVFASSQGTLTPNHKKYCKFTKDLLINSIIAIGSTNWFK